MSANRTPFLRSDGVPTGLRACSDRARVAARLVYDDGLSRADAARDMGISIATLRSLLEQYRQHAEDMRLVEAMRGGR